VKRTQHIGWIKDYLKQMGRPCNTIEILDYINDTTKHGMRVQSLGNVLAKNPSEFVRVGSESIGAYYSGRYFVACWDLSENYINHN